MITERKARKKWVCDWCGREINIGKIYIETRGRYPKINEFDNQIGIEYILLRECVECTKYTEEYK